MNKQEYIKRLTEALTALPQDERDAAAAYYSDYISDAENELAAINELPAPEQLAQTILRDSGVAPNPYAESNKKDRKASTYTIVFTVLLIPVIIPLIITVYSCLLALTATGFALAASALFTLLISSVTLFIHPPTGLFMFGAALILAGSGILLGMLTLKIIPPTAKLTARLFKKAYAKKGAEI